MARLTVARFVFARRLAGIAALVLLAGCATPTPFQPAANGNDFGYSEQQIEANRYRVSFNGNYETPLPTVENYLLYRAAELTKLNNGDYFVDVSTNTVAATRYDEFPTGGYGFRRRWGGYVGGEVTTSTRFGSLMDIQIFSGKKPADNPHAYDASEVLTRLAPVIVHPAG
jgi:hypothetical protein